MRGAPLGERQKLPRDAPKHNQDATQSKPRLAAQQASAERHRVVTRLALFTFLAGAGSGLVAALIACLGARP